MADYLPEVAQLDRRIFPSPAQFAEWLGAGTSVEMLPIPADTQDGMLGSFWGHPEWVLDEQARMGTSGFARRPKEVVQRAVSAVRRDLADGSWDQRHGHLRELSEYDAGLRLVIDHQGADIRRLRGPL